MRTPTAVMLKSGSWRCQVCVNGTRIQFVCETKEEAEKKALLAKLSADTVKDTVVMEKITVGDAITRYIDQRANVLSPSTIKSYRSMRKYRFQDVMDRPITDNINWQLVINDEADEVTAKTVKNAWGLVSAVLEEYGISAGKIRLPQVIKKEHLFLEPDQIKELIKAIEGHKYEIGYLLCLHGLRRSEMLAVEKKDVSNGYIHVNGSIVYDDNGVLVQKETNKNVSSKRNVPVIIPRLQELADASDDGILCPYPPSTIGDPLDTVCKHAGLPIIRLHGLRHSFVSLCYHLGISELQCMEFGGYSDINVMRKIYTHLASADRKAAENKLKDFFK